MKRKLQIGLWIALGILVLAVLFQIWSDQQTARRTIETERILKKTILPEVNFQDEPLSDALKKWYDSCCHSNPEFKEITLLLQVENFQSNSAKNKVFQYLPIDEIPEIQTNGWVNLQATNTPAAKVVEYISRLEGMRFQIQGEQIFVHSLHAPRLVSFSDKISIRLSQIADKIKDIFVADPSDPLS